MGKPMQFMSGLMTLLLAEEDFWQMFGMDLVLLRTRWKIDISAWKILLKKRYG